MSIRATTRQFLKELYRKTADDDILNGAAVLGFYLMLAIFPAMIFVLAVIPYLPIANIDQAIMDLLRQALPASAADMFAGVVQEVTQEQRGDLLSFGLLVALWATSTGMYAIMQQLNIAYPGLFTKLRMQRASSVVQSRCDTSDEPHRRPLHARTYHTTACNVPGAVR